MNGRVGSCSPGSIDVYSLVPLHYRDHSVCLSQTSTTKWFIAADLEKYVSRIASCHCSSFCPVDFVASPWIRESLVRRLGFSPYSGSMLVLPFSERGIIATGVELGVPVARRVLKLIRKLFLGAHLDQGLWVGPPIRIPSREY